MSDTNNHKQEAPEIIFINNPVYSLYSLWRNCMQYPGGAKEAIQGFNDERMNSISEFIPERSSKTMRAVEKVQALIGKNKVSTLEGVMSLMDEHFNTNDSKALGAVFETAFPAYQKFIANSQPRINQNLQTLNKEQGLYNQELVNLYKCFDVPTEKTAECYFNAFPKSTVIDGISNSENVSIDCSLDKDDNKENANMDCSLNRNENSENYIGNSDILLRKASTPLHEVTHFLVNNSPLNKDLYENKLPGIQSSAKYIAAKYLAKGNGQPPSDAELTHVVARTFNESFAACSTALYNEKSTGTPVPEGGKWYHGWPEANDLTESMYPLFKECVAEGKKFDDNFFQKLSARLKIAELRARCNKSEAEKPISDGYNLHAVESNKQTPLSLKFINPTPEAQSAIKDYKLSQKQ